MDVQQGERRVDIQAQGRRALMVWPRALLGVCRLCAEREGTAGGAQHAGVLQARACLGEYGMHAGTDGVCTWMCDVFGQ
jgi:hypothetical protein